MFAGAEGVDGKIGTRAVIVSDSLPANRDAIFPLGLRIGHNELRENRFIPDVLQTEILFLGKLPSQSNLPLFQRHILRLTKTRNLCDLPTFRRFLFGFSFAATR